MTNQIPLIPSAPSATRANAPWSSVYELLPECTAVFLSFIVLHGLFLLPGMPSLPTALRLVDFIFTAFPDLSELSQAPHWLEYLTHFCNDLLQNLYHLFTESPWKAGTLSFFSDP